MKTPEAVVAASTANCQKVAASSILPSPVYHPESPGEIDTERWLQKTIRDCGSIMSNSVIKVDRFLNHQIQPRLMAAIGHALAQRFKSEGVTKVLTVEASGIAPSYATAFELDVPMIYGRTRWSLTNTSSSSSSHEATGGGGGDDDYFHVKAYSFTKQIHQDVIIKRDLLEAHDRVLIIDDILAYGETTLALMNICQQAGAIVVGVGVVIEKSFQPGRTKLELGGIRVESLARIESMDPLTNNISFFPR